MRAPKRVKPNDGKKEHVGAYELHKQRKILPAKDLARLVYVAVMEMLDNSCVPLPVAYIGVRLALDEIEQRQDNEDEVSWVLASDIDEMPVEKLLELV